MNNITTKQNEQSELRKLAAQRSLYSRAKVVQYIQVILNVVVSIILGTVVAINKNVEDYLVLYGVLVPIFDALILEPNIKSNRDKAVEVQESFDCSILELVCSPFKKSDISADDIIMYSKKYKRKKGYDDLKNWYSIKIRVVDISLARILCQRSNCQWDYSIRHSYKSYFYIPPIILLITLVVLGFLIDMPIRQWLIAVSVLIPFFTFSIKQYRDNNDAIAKLKNTMSHIDKVWDVYANSYRIHKDKLLDEARIIQNEIYDQRSSNPLIFDLYYRFYKEDGEDAMEELVDTMIMKVR